MQYFYSYYFNSMLALVCIPGPQDGGAPVKKATEAIVELVHAAHLPVLRPRPCRKHADVAPALHRIGQGRLHLAVEKAGVPED
jgi:hypothetical protein